MSTQQPGDRPIAPSSVPEEYSDAYERAYRNSLAEHPTEFLSPARPGKRSAQPLDDSRVGTRLAVLVADLLSKSRYRPILGAAVIVVLLVVAFVIGRLLG